jgi:hypothetical protein
MSLTDIAQRYKFQSKSRERNMNLHAAGTTSVETLFQGRTESWQKLKRLLPNRHGMHDFTFANECRVWCALLFNKGLKPGTV